MALVGDRFGKESNDTDILLEVNGAGWQRLQPWWSVSIGFDLSTGSAWRWAIPNRMPISWAAYIAHSNALSVLGSDFS